MRDQLMANFSICIPTYNRSALLRQCLEHLARDADMGFEIIVGDNASTDATEAVVRELSPRFPAFVYLRHKTNIGFARNMDAILRRATREYLYVLCDDDLVFVDGLRVAGSVLDGNPDVSAVVGKYLSLRRVDANLTMTYHDATASTIPRGAYQVLLDNITITDGHPIMRREVYHKHCTYLDRTGALMPLYFNLLRHGNIVAVDRPFFQHLANSESLTGRMSDAAFLDMTNADFELALGDCRADLNDNALEDARRNFMRLMYFQAARMAIGRKQQYLVWLFLKRMAALDPGQETLMVRAEAAFIHDFLLERLTTLIADGQYGDVVYSAAPTTELVVSILARTLTEVRFARFEEPGDARGFHLRDGRSPAGGWQGCGVAIEDLCDQVRLTRHGARLAVRDGRLALDFIDAGINHTAMQAVPSFEVLTAPYWEIASTETQGRTT